ncbi:MAG: SGNH/GDSL hydrolase family protein [Proteobacteria bacterium]|nr:SGNH/GDSL hydrolase family protein [Pseudomonadota bacterium]
MIAVNLGLLMAFAVVIELIFGSIFFGENYGILVVDRNASRRFDATERYGGGITEYRRDKHGLRGKYPDPSKIDILTIGGSTTNEILIDEGKTWSDRLAAEFAIANRPMVVVNAGVDGQSTVGHLKIFELWFPKIPNFRPRYILAYIGINELGHVQPNRPANKWELMIESNKTIKQYLKNNSALYGLYRTAKGMIRAREAMLVHSTPGGPYEWKAPALPPDVAAAEMKFASFLDAYGARVRELIRRIRDLGAKPVIVTQHFGHYRLRGGLVFGLVAKERYENVWMGRVIEKGTVDIGSYESLMAHNRRAMKVCQEVKAICIDVSEELEFEDGDHYDLLHTTPKGSAKIAKFIFERLKAQID